MAHVNDDDVRERAFKLWEKAGKPDRKMDEFWYEAERQLQDEQVKHASKAPDTL
jgi:hypothetical protein